jgi:hypothetical protein
LIIESHRLANLLTSLEAFWMIAVNPASVIAFCSAGRSLFSHRGEVVASGRITPTDPPPPPPVAPDVAGDEAADVAAADEAADVAAADEAADVAAADEAADVAAAEVAADVAEVFDPELLLLLHADVTSSAAAATAVKTRERFRMLVLSPPGEAPGEQQRTRLSRVRSSDRRPGERRLLWPQTYWVPAHCG